MKTLRELMGIETEEFTVKVSDVRKRLKAEGYDGLYNNGCDCLCTGCDLLACGEPSDDCVAGIEGPPSSDDWDIGLYPTREAAELAKARAER